MKYVFIDMDGVIAEYGYPSGSYDGEFQRGNYLGKKPIETVINRIIEKYNNQDYIVLVCSASPNAKATLEKNEWLNRFFGVPYENRIFIGKDEDKVEVIKYYIEDMLHGSVQEHALIIDDKGSILAKAHSLGIECYHPTQLIAMMEEEKAAEQQKNEVQDNTPQEGNQPEDINEETIENTESISSDESLGEQMTIEDLQQMMDESIEIEEIKEEE